MHVCDGHRDGHASYGSSDGSGIRGVPRGLRSSLYTSAAWTGSSPRSNPKEFQFPDLTDDAPPRE